MRSPLLRAGLFAALVVITGCSDAVVPEAAAPADPARGLLSGLLQVDVLQRLRPLSRSYTATATIGSAGGTIRIPEAGFSIRFPAGAVSTPVTVQATAVSGGNVAYRFEPHGLRFQAEPVITQDLSLTEVVQQLLLLRELEGGYYADDAALGNGTAVVSETRPATTSLLSMKMSFTIQHFSGYVASRRPGGYISSSGTRLPAP